MEVHAKTAKGGKYAHIEFKPPASVAKAAKRGLELRKENNGKGGTAVGVARARDLGRRANMSPDTVRRMKAFFDRHQKNKKASGGKKLSEDKGYIAWLLWGGDPGYSWAKKVVRQMEAADKKGKAKASAGDDLYMTIGNLEQIARDAMKILSMAGNVEHMEPWVDDKITQAKTHLNAIRNYLESEQTDLVHVGAGAESDGDSDKVQRKYLGNLKGEERERRRREIDKRRDEPSDDPGSYREFRTDKGKKPRRRSDATIAYEKRFGKKKKASVIEADAKLDKALKNKSEDSGIGVTVLRQVYNRGLAAWRTGHRPGAGQHQWAMARVNSFITGKGGARKADSDLWSKAKKQKDKKKSKKKASADVAEALRAVADALASE